LRNVIVGIDAGLNSGVAILSTEGELLLLNTFRGYNRGTIIREILKIGRPILLATDRKKAPKAIKELASSFGCRILRPKRDLNREEKEEITIGYKEKIKDDHQLDALSSALYAYRKVKRKIETVKHFLTKKGLMEYFDEALYYLFKLRDVNLEWIINELAKEEKEEEIVQKKEKKKEGFVELFKERIELEKELERLRKELNSYRKLKLQFDELLKYKDGFEKLSHYFEIIKSMEKARGLGLVPVLPLEKIENLEELDSHLCLEGRVVFSNDTSGFKLLNNYGIKCLLTEVSFEGKTKYPVLKIEKGELKKIGNIYAIEEKTLDEKLKEVMKEEIRRWIEEERER